MNVLKLGKIALLEVVAIISSISIGIAWMFDSNGPYEPYLVCCGLVWVCTDFYRRYKVQPTISKHKETINNSPPKSPFVKIEKVDGAIAQCPSAMCNRVAMTVEDAEAYFGFRKLANGKNLVQSYCRACR
ncbi:hypothetical protein L5M43_14500 [Shewanella sp. SW36]|uniref:hypothetical protein n=1 Tax=unclassified Shewanella TaxID=196818 RepID=UPI0021D9EC17|nr:MULTISPECIES: hypothetical protein [unclassified Shewanella]MCU7963844.1 hypothetical protein [Shewanella sp. SW32]MCU7971670.1 hypothetical protein [Shewanella sp. SW29]MCU7976449.1 hypothetical protein [Shewanella sp. SW36]MCU7991689.1 hypothetical protein [Shewanella sp. SW1]MCU8053069.1 hypothetical protein [Shewanella sp. SM43]